jgi:UDP-GlcNAc3NAcA epimerase
MHILTIVGARPQFIKAAVVSRVIRNREGVQESIVHTGQHYDPNMSDIFFDELDIPRPAIHLGVGSGMHGKQTGDMLSGIEKAILDLKPDWLLIYGDTNSTLAGALAAAKLHVPIAHVEAGLRSFNRRMPEEINRVVSDVVSTLLFTPTEVGAQNLANEGIHKGVIRTGDVMYDAALYYGERSTGRILADANVVPGKYILCTVHRAENTDDPARLKGILEGLQQVAKKLPVVLPLHPRTRNILKQQGLAEPAGVKIIDPVSYLDMVALEKSAAVLLTDSGGVQKEAYFYGVPCVTMRDETEWTETVTSGWNTLVGADPARIVAAVDKALAGRPGEHPALYGDGKAGEKIVDSLVTYRP